VIDCYLIDIFGIFLKDSNKVYYAAYTQCTCRTDSQVPKRKLVKLYALKTDFQVLKLKLLFSWLVKKYFLVAKLAQYFVCEKAWFPRY